MFRRQEVLVRIQARVMWEVVQAGPDQHWFGVCRPLNLNAAGDTFEEFQACANEAITLLLQSLLQRNELQAFLQRNGWRVATPIPQPNARARFELPYGIQFKDRFEELAGASA